MSKVLKFIFLLGLIVVISTTLLLSQKDATKKSASIEEKRAESSSKAIMLIPLAETDKTGWANFNKPLPFPGEENDPKGFARYMESVELEDENAYSKVLLTYPESKEKIGMIIGIFQVGKLPENATFKAKVGFLKGANQTDGVKFKVSNMRDPRIYAEKTCYYDGKLDDLVLSLDQLAGHDIQVLLTVHVIDSYHQDLAVWVDPRIEW